MRGLSPSSASRACFVFPPPDNHTGDAEHSDNNPHEGNKNTARQAQDPAGVYGELRLYKKVGSGTLPGDKVAEVFAAMAVKIQCFMSNATGAVSFVGTKEFSAIQPEFSCVPQRPQWLLPATLCGVVCGNAVDIAEAQIWRNGIVVAGRLSGVEGRGRYIGDE